MRANLPATMNTPIALEIGVQRLCSDIHTVEFFLQRRVQLESASVVGEVQGTTLA